MNVEVVPWDPRYAGAFAALNYEWIETEFEVEEEDRRALGDPLGYAVSRGGEIFFVLEAGEPVGTVAMVPKSPGMYELAKMAVRPDRRGAGYGHRLMQACIDWARGQGGHTIFLVTNDRLAPALGLYRSAGFEATASYDDPRYERGNLEMRLRL